jgi:hypothetical protein
MQLHGRLFLFNSGIFFLCCLGWLLGFSLMKATLFAGTLPPPTACPNIFARHNSTRTGGATNAGIALGMQGIDWNVIHIQKGFCFV